MKQQSQLMEQADVTTITAVEQRDVTTITAVEQNRCNNNHQLWNREM